MPSDSKLSDDEQTFLGREDVRDLPEHEKLDLVRAQRRQAFWPLLLSLPVRLVLLGGASVALVHGGALGDVSANAILVARVGGVLLALLTVWLTVLTVRRLARLRAPL